MRRTAREGEQSNREQDEYDDDVGCAKAREQKKMANEKTKKSVTRSRRDGSSVKMVWRQNVRIEGRSEAGARSGRSAQSLVASGVRRGRGHAASGSGDINTPQPTRTRGVAWMAYDRRTRRQQMLQLVPQLSEGIERLRRVI
jgi:hypothetical protein